MKKLSDELYNSSTTCANIENLIDDLESEFAFLADNLCEDCEVGRQGEVKACAEIIKNIRRELGMKT